MAANMKEIKAWIDSVKSTSQITKAMDIVTGMATQLAEKIIKENIGDKQDTIIDNFINEIGE